MRLAAALREGEPNILLTDYLTANSRMMIRRKVQDRLQELAGFLQWDSDPYLVITDSGRLVWMVDGYTTSDAHPYSRAVDVPEVGAVNYIRNAVKATVDAYDGETHLYIFAPDDPIIDSYQRLFPNLFLPHRHAGRSAARTPATRKRCSASRRKSTARTTCSIRSPSTTRRTCGTWRGVTSARPKAAQAVDPVYIVATLPGETKPEFLLMLPFTPRNKDNLIGLMAARCDGPHLGEVVVLQLSKQELIFGPMQIAARINQDQTISKDLTLWNQQGSQVLRGQTLVLPVGNTFLYVDADLHPGHREPHAAVEEGGAGGRQPADLCRHLRRSAGPAFERRAAVGPAGRARPRRRQPAPAAAAARRPGRRCRGWRASASTCGAIATWRRKANGPKPARSWKRSKRRWGNNSRTAKGRGRRAR